MVPESIARKEIHRKLTRNRQPFRAEAATARAGWWRARLPSTWPWPHLAPRPSRESIKRRGLPAPLGERPERVAGGGSQVSVCDTAGNHTAGEGLSARGQPAIPLLVKSLGQLVLSSLVVRRVKPPGPSVIEGDLDQGPHVCLATCDGRRSVGQVHARVCSPQLSVPPCWEPGAVVEVEARRSLGAGALDAGLERVGGQPRPLRVRPRRSQHAPLPQKPFVSPLLAATPALPALRRAQRGPRHGTHRWLSSPVERRSRGRAFETGRLSLQGLVPRLLSVRRWRGEVPTVRLLLERRVAQQPSTSCLGGG